MKRRIYKYCYLLLLLCASGISHGQQLRSVPDSVAQRMQKDDAFWYANDPSFWSEERPPGYMFTLARIFSSNLFKWTLYALLAAVLAFAIYKIVLANNFFTRHSSRKKAHEKDTHPDDAPEDIDQQLAAAIASGQYRLATRFYYLKTLSLLSNLNKIRLHAKSTNQEYIHQMRAYPNGTEFDHLTGIYEYVWYGEFQPSAAQFDTISRAFNQFNRHP